MTEGKCLYRVVLSGRPLEGFSEEQMKSNLASGFRMPLEEIERRITGKPVAIKSGLDRETAERFAKLLEKAGAECSIVDETRMEEKPPVPEAPAQTAPGAATEEPSAAAAGPRVITAPQKPVSLQFSPIQCRILSGAEGGLNFNRYSSDAAPFGQLLLVSVYNVPAGVKQRTRLLVFMKTQKKPVLVDDEAIRFEDFPFAAGGTPYETMRGFLAWLLTMNPDLCVDASTDAFLKGGEPEVFRREDALRASSLGAALDAEKLFLTARPAAAKPSGQDAAAPGSQTAAAQDEGPKYSEEDLLRLFVGPEAGKYLGHFRQFDSGGGKFSATWHWPAFFANFLWFLYRKMYLHAIAFFVLLLVPVVNLFACIGAGRSGYFLYYRHAKSIVTRITRYSGSKDPAYLVAAEGGVSQPAVFAGAGILAVVVIVASIGMVTSLLARKQEKLVDDLMNMTPLVPVAPGAPGATGIPMPANPEQAMQMAYDTTARADLRNACTAAQVFFSTEETQKPVTMADLEKYGFRPRPEVTVQILNSSPDTLRMSARHSQGSATIHIDKDCRFEQ